MSRVDETHVRGHALSGDAPAQETRAPVRVSDHLAVLARLVRVEYCALGAAGVFLGAFLATSAVPGTPVVLTSLAVVFVAAGCYAFDDLADMACDRANARADRPLAAGVLSSRVARVAGSFSFVVAAAAAVAAGTASGLLIGLGALTAMVYNRWLQGLLPLKNILFAAVFPVTLIAGWLASGGAPTNLFRYMVALVFIAGLGFETMIDVADADGDRRTGIVTFATHYGTLLSSRLGAALHLAAAMLLVLLFFLPVDARLRWNVLFLGMAAVAALSSGLIGFSLSRNHGTARVFALKRQAFLTLNAGMVAVVVGLLTASL